MYEEIFDVALQSTGHFHADDQTFLDHSPPYEDMSLGHDLWIGSLPKDLDSKVVFDACEAAGYNFRPSRQYGMRYAFCRQVRPLYDEYYQWDKDSTVGRTMFLSRLIRPTTIATSVSARVYFADNKLRTIVPGPTQTLSALAFVVAKDNWRDWLSVLECEQLRDLLPFYECNPPDRVRRARRHLDNAFHTFYLDQRFASLVTSFESLLKVSDYQSTKQFASRVPRLANMLGLELSGMEAKSMYQTRSAFVHGSEVSFSKLEDEEVEKYNRFERVLRLALLRASTEPVFAAQFSSSKTVESAFGA